MTPVCTYNHEREERRARWKRKEIAMEEGNPYLPPEYRERLEAELAAKQAKVDIHIQGGYFEGDQGAHLRSVIQEMRERGTVRVSLPITLPPGATVVNVGLGPDGEPFLDYVPPFMGPRET